MGRRSGATFVSGILILMLLTILPTTSADDAGGIAISEDSISISPSTLTEGSTAQISVVLQNTVNQLADDVSIEFHKNQYFAGSPSAVFSVDIDANDIETVEMEWTNVQFGENRIYVRVSYGGDNVMKHKEFDVEGLPNLRVSTLNVPAESFADDVIPIAIEIENSGNADAAASHIELTFAGTSNMISVPPLASGSQVWLNQTDLAPSAGDYEVEVEVNADSNDGVIETTDADNRNVVILHVISDPDYHHGEGILLSPSIGLAGPWTLSGEVVRDGGSGSSSLNMTIRLLGGIDLVTIPLSFTENQPSAVWNHIIQAANLPDASPGDVVVEAAIDPEQEVEQSSTFNDIEQLILTIFAEPNVVVSPSATASPGEVGNGESVTFTVTLQNVGMVEVSGTLTATFDGNHLDSRSIHIPPASSATQGTLTAFFDALVQGADDQDFQFTATWQMAVGSYDRLTSDNQAVGTVSLTSALELRFIQESENWEPGLPLYNDYDYVYTIEIIADRGIGSETIACVESSRGVIHDEVALTFTEQGQRQTLRCQIFPSGVGTLELSLVTQGASAPTLTQTWEVELRDADQNTIAGLNTPLAIALMTLGALGAIVALVSAVILTRRGLADAERETYEICPACEGEIEGDEEACPYCEFDLTGGRSSFHDCDECGATIPDMMEHCAYCGTEQDVSSRFERRDRKHDPAVVEEEVVEDEDEDDDEIVRGHQDFDSTTSGMGSGSADWEEEWDDSLEEAESHFEGIDAEYDAVEALEKEISESKDDFVAATHLSSHLDEMSKHDLDAFLGDVSKRTHLVDDEVELTASDAHYRSHLYDMTGEDGVMPGDKVNAESIPDHSIVGNELQTATSDFTVPGEPDTDVGVETTESTEESPAEESPAEESPAEESEETEDKKSEKNSEGKRRGVRRRKSNDS